MMSVKPPVSVQIEAIAAKRPSLLALSGSGVTLTYGAMNAVANRIAHAILARAEDSGPSAAVLCDHHPMRLTAGLAVLKSGKALVLLDATYPDHALADLIAHAESTVVIADGANLERARRLVGASRLIAAEDPGTSLPETDPGVVLAPESLAYLRYTSGSTGMPKGAMLTHRNLSDLASEEVRRQGILTTDRFAQFNVVWIGLVLSVLTNGASLHLYDLKREGLRRVGEWLVDERITVFVAIPTVLRQLSACVPPGFRADTVRQTLLSGETALASDAALAWRLFGPDCEVINIYASSEISQIATYRCKGTAPPPDGPLPAGRPVPGVDLVLLGEDGRPVGPGERGEVAVRSAYVTSGYWRAPDLSDRIFVPDPERPGQRLHVTGDVGWIDSAGDLHVAGRRDHQVKVRGHRVLPDEIEQVLLAHPAVAEAVVDPVPGSDVRLAAYVVARPDAGADATALRRFLQERLPDPLVPTWIVPLSRLPRLAGGKVDRASLPAPAPATVARPGPDPAYADRVERELAALWRDALEVPRAGPDDDFFALGGDSLGGARLIVAVGDRFGVELLPDDLLGAGRTLAGLARLVRARAPRVRPAGPPVAVDVDFADLNIATAGRRNAALFHVERATGLRRARPGARWGGIAINRLGFRGPDLAIPKPAGTTRLAFLGDSATFDAHVGGNEDTWVHRACRELEARAPGARIDYVNASLPGYGSRQLAVLFAGAVAPLAPDLTLIAISDANADTARYARERHGYRGLHIRPSPLARRWVSWARVEKSWLSLWRRTAAVLGRGIADLPSDLADDFARRLEAVVEQVRRAGSVPVLVLLPRRLRPGQGRIRAFASLASAAYYMPHLSLEGFRRAHALYGAAIREVARKEGVGLIDLGDALPSDGRHFRDSHHFTTQGSRRLGAAFADALLADPRLAAILRAGPAETPARDRSAQAAR